jgi:hypothetical protein
LPFCSKTTDSDVSLAPGAATVTSSGVAAPTNFSGLPISIDGPPIRPPAT